MPERTTADAGRPSRAELRERLAQLKLSGATDNRRLTRALKDILDDINRRLQARFERLLEQLAPRFGAAGGHEPPPLPPAVDELVRERAELLDVLLEFVWNRFDWRVQSSFFAHEISLLAVGGYGRGELHPGSDLDLLILLNTRDYDACSDNIRKFTALLWDLGLKVGHSVRSISDCRRLAKDDLGIMTSLMETRTLAGAAELRGKLTRTLNRHLWNSAEFHAGKQEEQLRRDGQWEHTGHRLEPNLKTSPGGLRDLHTIFWVAGRHFGETNMDELVRREFLSGEEAAILAAGRRFLWLIRYALHRLAGRGEDRLGFDHQRRLASLLGYRDTELPAVEQFMRHYYRTAARIRDVNELSMQFFLENRLENAGRRVVRPLNERFRICNDFIEVADARVFEKNPSALLEMFVLMSNDNSIRGVRAATLRLLRGAVGRIDDDFRGNPENAALFMRLLGGRHRLSSLLARMARHGLLGAWLPEFGRVVGQMQFDLVHLYTVDAHSLQVVRNMRRFRYRENRRQFPVATQLLPRLPKLELLYIAGLYHDLGKGLGGDHARRGVAMVRDFARRHRLPDWDTRLVCWLVEHHLVMSSTAQRRDISDPEVVREFARFVGDQVRLDYLYALTVADITATNPKLWNSWRASLMWQLYSETRRALRNGLENLLDRDALIQSVREQAGARLAASGLGKARVRALWEGLDAEYFICEPVQDIVRQAELVLGAGDDDKPLILMRDRLRNQAETGCTRIFIHIRRRRRAFGIIAAALDQLNLDIVDAHLFLNSRGRLFTSFIVLEQNGQPVGEDAERREEIIEHLQRKLRERNPEIQPVQRLTPNALQQFRLPTEVGTRNTERCTLLTVVTPDRPGLLAKISRLLSELKVDFRAARIITLGERVEDVFQLVDEHEGPIRDEMLLERVKTGLRLGLDEGDRTRNLAAGESG